MVGVCSAWWGGALGGGWGVGGMGGRAGVDGACFSSVTGI